MSCICHSRLTVGYSGRPVWIPMSITRRPHPTPVSRSRSGRLAGVAGVRRTAGERRAACGPAAVHPAEVALDVGASAPWSVLPDRRALEYSVPSPSSLAQIRAGSWGAGTDLWISLDAGHGGGRRYRRHQPGPVPNPVVGLWPSVDERRPHPRRGGGRGRGGGVAPSTARHDLGSAYCTPTAWCTFLAVSAARLVLTEGTFQEHPLDETDTLDPIKSEWSRPRNPTAGCSMVALRLTVP